MDEKCDFLVRASWQEPTDEPEYFRMVSMDMIPLMVPTTPMYLTFGMSRTLIVGAVVRDLPDRSMSYLSCPLVSLLARSHSEILISSVAICARRRPGRPCLLLPSPVQLVSSLNSEGDTEIKNRTAAGLVSVMSGLPGLIRCPPREVDEKTRGISRTKITVQALVRKMWL